MEKDEPQQPDTPSKHHRVIQPVSDMSEYAPKEPPAEPEPAADTRQPEPPKHTGIYPDAKKDVAQIIAAPATPHTNESRAYVSNDSAAARVPVLRIYAFVNIAYALYLAYRVVSSGIDVGSMFLGMFLGSAFHLIIAIYLLAAKDLRVVSGLLLGLIISDTLTVINMATSLVQVREHVHMGVITPLLITTGLLAFTWYTRIRVDLTSVEA